MEELQKQLIEKYKISATYFANTKKWGETRCHFKIKVFNKEFDYFDNVYNFKKDIRKQDMKGILFGFYCIISDAISYTEYTDNIADFALDFGYIENSELPNFKFYMNSKYRRSDLEEYLSLKELEKFKSCVEAYSGCEDTFYKLESTKKFEYNLKTETLYNIMEELRNAGIE